MQKRPFYFASLLTLIAALCLDLCASSLILEGIRLTKAWNKTYLEMEKAEHLRETKGRSLVNAPKTRPQLSPEIVQLNQRAGLLTMIGLTCDLFGAALLIAARRRKESGWYSLPILLLVFNVMGIGILGANG